MFCDGLNILQGAADTADATNSASRFGNFSDLAICCFGVADPELRDCA